MTRTGQPRDGRPLSGPEHYWAQMREHSAKAGGFTIGEVHGASNGVCRATVQHYVLGCLEADAIEEVGADGDGSHAAKRYRVKVNTVEAPTEGKGFAQTTAGKARANLWTAMRALDAFTPRQLAIAASTDDVQVSHRAAQAYCTALRRAEYLGEVQAAGGGRSASLRLRPGRNTGPKAPVISRHGQVVDRNRAPANSGKGGRV